MTRGKKVDINEYLKKIEEYLEIGSTLREACILGVVPYQTVLDHFNQNPQVRLKIEKLQEKPIFTARNTLAKGIKTDPDLALKFLERKRKNEFSTKSEVDNNLVFKKMDRVLKKEKSGKATPIIFDVGEQL